MDDYFENLGATLGAFLPTLLAAIAVLIIGWLIALVVSSLVRSLLKRTTLDNRIANMMRGSESPRPEQIRVEKWVGAAVFWLIMFFTIIVFLQTLNLTAISAPLGNVLDQILAFIPGLLSALILLVIAWLIATFLRLIVTRVLNASGLARRLSDDADVRPQDRVMVSQTLGNIVYWLVFLLFLPAILSALNLQGILAPVQGVVDEILGVLPNLLGAALILAVGWLAARIVRQIVTNLLVGLGVDRIGAQAGVPAAAERFRLSEVIGTIVYVLILIPVAIAALNTLNIPAISTPASNMLTNLLNALPLIFGAIVLIGIAYFVGRIVGKFVAGILTNIGFNRIFTQMGLYREAGPIERGAADVYSTTTGAAAGPGAVQPLRTSPAEIVGYLVTVAILLFASMEAASLLGFETLAALISRFIVAATQVLIGLVIFGIGLYLSRWAERVIRDSGASQANILAPAARVAIIIFSGALALREMGIAESIVNLAFGLLLGAVAVAVALAFGLGGREVASRQLERWQQSLRSGSVTNPPDRSLGRPDLPEPPIAGD